MFIESWDEFAETASRMYLADPKNVRAWLLPILSGRPSGIHLSNMLSCFGRVVRRPGSLIWGTICLAIPARVTHPLLDLA